MHEYLPASHASIADALVETRSYWDGMDTSSKDTVMHLPDDVVERLAVAYFEMYDVIEFKPLRERIKELSSSEDPQDRHAGDVLARFFTLLCTLCSADVEAFNRRRPTAAEIVERSMAGGDWDTVAEDLKYLEGVSEKYWRYVSAELHDPPAIQHLTSADLRVLASIAKTVNRERHVSRITKCQNADITNVAYEKMQCVMQLLDELDLLH